MSKWIVLLFCSFLALGAMISPSSAADLRAIEVGRIFYIEGDLLRYVPAEKDWVAVVRDAPFGTEDTLFSGDRGMAEMIIPNGTWIRTGNSTQIQFITLDTDLSEMDLASGVARFYNKSSDTFIKVTSPFGYVLSYPGTVFDFYVGENSVEVVAVKGKVSFVHSATEAKYSVAAGSPSILADQQQVSSAEGIVDPDWNRWNATRENFWAAKARLKGRSAEYLPPSLHDQSYILDESGRWERVPYEGSERWFWRPRVSAGWSPFTVGRWTDWYGDQTWIPAEPFGYITHHYGNWVRVGHYWYWAPPVVRVRVGLPLLNVGFFWSPGRVSWIHSGTYVGWVPLAPRETYYSHRRWGGPHTMVITGVNLPGISINLRNYAYVNRAIVVPQRDFYGVSNYRNVRVTTINSTTIINNYRAAPVINNTVVKGYTTDKERHNFTNVKVNEKPHHSVINRIQQNQAIIREGREERPSVLQERMKSIPEGKVNREARIETPKVTNHIVPASQVNRPKSEIKFQQREIKASGKPDLQGKPAARPERVAPERPAPPEQPAPRPERVAPARPAPPEQPAPRPERVAPARPNQQEKPAARPERVKPPKPSQKEKPDQPDQPAPLTPRPERVSPAKPVQPEQPAAQPERVAPARPNQQEKPAARPERVKPPKPSQKDQPDQPAPPTPRPERVSPPKPVQPEQPAAQPERVAPSRPSQQEKPAARPERVKPPKPSQKDQPDQPAPPTPRPERVSPPKPAPPEQPAARPERVAPAKPSQQKKPAAPPERVEPPKPSQQDKPGQPAPPTPPPERVSPPKPVQPEPPAAQPERVAPAKPAEKGPVQKQIKKPKEPKSSEKNIEKQKEEKIPREESGKPEK